MKLGIFVNTLTTRNEGLTTHDLAFSALNLGHEVFFFPVMQLSANKRNIIGRGKKLTLEGIRSREQMTRNLGSFETIQMDLSRLDVLLLRHKSGSYRIPENFHKSAREYAYFLQENGVFVANDPQFIPFFSTKLSTLHLPESILPEKQVISNDFEEVFSFCKDELNYEGVMKPIGGKGGEDIYFTEKRNLRNTLKSILKKGPVLVQNYIPNDGDKRIILLEGEPIAWYKRVANEGEFINNISAGGKPVAFDLTPRDQEIIKALKSILIKYKMYIVGIDILGNFLSEVNSEVPGGTVRADKLGNFQSREKIIRFLESKVGSL